MEIGIRQKLHQLIYKCEALQRNGKYAECIDIMEQVLTIKKNVYGTDHRQFQKSTDKLCQYLNLTAMIYLQQQKFDLSIDLLRKAQLISQKSLQYKSITYNNLACYYRRLGKLKTALSYLIQALDLELKLQKPTTIADTHLNLCAVLSQLDRHDDALQHSMLSIILLQDQFLQVTLEKYKKQQNHENYQENIINDERLAVLAIAYHNMGVEFEYMKRYDQALSIYNKALKFSKDYLNQNQQLIENLSKVVRSAQQKLDQTKKKVIFNRKYTDKSGVENKKEVYKQFTKQIERYTKNLPKLQDFTNSNITQQKINRLKQSENGSSNHDRSFARESQMNFVGKKHSKVYRSKANSIFELPKQFGSIKDISGARQVSQN